MSLSNGGMMSNMINKQNSNNAIVAAMIGIGVGDVQLTFDNLFPIPMNPETYYKISIDCLAIQSTSKKQKYGLIVWLILDRILSVLKKVQNLTFESLFWIVFVMLFQVNHKEQIKERLKMIFKQHYGSFFIDLDTTDKDLILSR